VSAFLLYRGEILQGPVEATVVPPIDPSRVGEIDVGQLPVGPLMEDISADALGLKQPDDGLHEALVTPGDPRDAATRQRGYFPPAVKALRSELCAAVAVHGEGQVADVALHSYIRDGAGSDVLIGPCPGPVGPRCDRQTLGTKGLTDRLDSETLVSEFVDERQDQRLRGSSSRAKKIETRCRISLVSFNRRFSMRRRLSSEFSSVLTP